MASTRYTVRKGQPEDCKHIVRLLKEHATSAISNTEEDLQNDSFGDEPLYHFFVVEAMNDGTDAKENAAAEIVGFSAYFFSYSAWTGRMIDMDELYVQDSHRGKGLGKALMAKVAKVGVENKCIGMDWILGGSNKSAWPFYNHLKSIDMSAHFGWRFMTVSGENFAQLVNSEIKPGLNIQFQ
ncbi:diamine acetyltransferase 1-like [Patiria miniata]|uniref:N-acetyltransferase domain-containing protein n=1 Tax=Patiria miniata TaxID=46514 RepID=A0A913ZHH9_PATMI|nr:diamine acetyltransferase 1-like [Patiria miniata]